MLVANRPFPLASRPTIIDIIMDRSTSSSISDDEYRSNDQDKTPVLPTPERRKRRRRGKKRKYMPYAKMTAEERKDSGLPGAPSNTTQFIMEDRGEAAVHYPSPSRLARSVSYESSPSGWALPSPDIYCSTFHFLLGDDDAWVDSSDDPQEPDAFLEEDFNQVYAQLRMDRLDHMSKDDLVHQCMDLEQKVVSLQEDRDRQTVLQRELSELKERNSELLKENQRLRTTIPSSVS